MKPDPRRLFIAFALVSMAELYFIATGQDSFRIFTKPLLIPLLAGIYWASSITKPFKFRDFILLGLLFSWVGDVMLQMDGFFIPGLVSFLLAHVFYILFFSKTEGESISFFKSRPVMLIAVLAYLVELMYLLWPTLGGMKIPVMAYGITISVMLSAALWQYQKLDGKTSLFFILGATLFVASDSLLALNKFRKPFETAGISIMSTYILAQLFIVMGAIRYRNRTTQAEDISNA